MAVCSAGWAGAAVCAAAVAVCSAGWAGAAVCGAAAALCSAGWLDVDGLRFGRGRRLGEFGRGLARLAGLCLRPGRRGCGDRRNRFGLGDHRRLGRGGLGRLRSRFAARRGRWLRCRGRWLRCRGCRLRCRGRRRIWGLGRRHGGLGHALWRGVALLRGGRLGDQIAVQLPPLAILAGGQLEHPQRGARLAHHELPVPHARDGLRRQAAADQRGLHRIGARARQPMRVQSVIPGDLVRSDMTDHLSGQKTVRADGTGQLGQILRRRRGQLSLAGCKRQHVNRYVRDPPVLQHQRRRSQQGLGAGGARRTLGRKQPKEHQGGNAHCPGNTKWLHGLDLPTRLT